LCWSNAGHLPPVVLGPDGQVRLLRGGGGVPSRETRAEGNVTLAPGSTLLLYTDGLVETRTGDIDSDIQRLLTNVAGHRPTHGPQALVDRLVIGSGDHSDDIALLAVHVL